MNRGSSVEFVPEAAVLPRLAAEHGLHATSTSDFVLRPRPLFAMLFVTLIRRDKNGVSFLFMISGNMTGWALEPFVAQCEQRQV